MGVGFTEIGLKTPIFYPWNTPAKVVSGVTGRPSVDVSKIS